MLAAAHNIQCGEHKPIMQKLLSMTDVNIKSKVVREVTNVYCSILEI